MRNGLRTAVLAAVAVVLSAAAGWSDPPAANPADKGGPKLPTKKEVMAAKLKQSQVVLEGIALNDFDKIGTAADELVRISRATDFLDAYKGEEYRFQITTFRRAAETIGLKAKDKNMDGVMVAYNDLTLSCLKCHQGMRDKKYDALRPLPDRPAPARGE